MWLASPRSFFTLRRWKEYNGMYRSIDTDERLLIMARRYWDEDDQLTDKQIHWVLGNEGYSEREIDNAISDYWAIHIRSSILLHYWIAPAILVLVMVYLVYYVHTLILRMG